ncbi:MAG: IPTL-CTERM sorting domain-containing protein [Deltaproteobacteria bacterium]|nr:IPTL-CTERM sorting domain-containing protein [Deltaproteobacteria bacterium]
MALVPVGAVVAIGAMSLGAPDLKADVLRVPADFATIQSAADAASSGDTILVAPGSYRERVVAFTKDLTIVSEAGAASTLLLGPKVDVPSNVWIHISSESTLQGFSLSSDPESAAWIRVSGVGTSGLPGALIADNVFDGAGAGLRFRPLLQFNDSAGRVERNIFRNWQIDQSVIDRGVVETVNSGTVEVINNLFADNQSTGVEISSNQTPNLVVNNHFLRNHKGIWAGAPSAGSVFRNNLLVDNEVGLDVHPFGPAIVWSNNLVWNNGEDFVGFADPTGMDGNLRADPLLLPGEDLLFSEGSPVVDTGTDLDAPPIDLQGSARPVDGDRNGVPLWDIGAIEFVPSAVSIVAVPTLDAPGMILMTVLLLAAGLWIRRKRRKSPSSAG